MNSVDPVRYSFCIDWPRPCRGPAIGKSRDSLSAIGRIDVDAQLVAHRLEAPWRAGTMVVVIDTLRAMTTVSTALRAGARRIVPAASIDEAVAAADRLGRDRVRLCGERDGLPIAGFDLGNSPLEYTPEAVGDKIVVLTTTNGTAALVASRGADAVLCGALVNAGRVAGEISARRPRRVAFVCSGTAGSFAIEDAIAAGAITDRLMDVRGARSLSMSDSARACHVLFQEAAADLEDALVASDHGRRLAAMGLAPDVSYCARLDLPDCPAASYDGRVILPSPTAHDVSR